MLYAEMLSLGRRVYTAIHAADWSDIRPLLAEDIRWVETGSHHHPREIRGADEVVAQLCSLSGRGAHVSVTQVVVSSENFTLSLHRVQRADAVSAERLTTVCRLAGGKIDSIETHQILA